MKQVFIGPQGVQVRHLPAPTPADGELLVEVRYSLISTGTEVAALSSSAELPFRKALASPGGLGKAMKHVRNHGVRKTIEKALGKKGGAIAVGYSCSGVVLENGSGVEGLRRGDEVACAGSGRAYHAEVVAVPKNLVVPVPSGCTLPAAASVALGAIALQGVRRADTKIGETVAVVGLGLVGQLTVQILRAAGCRPFGVDVEPQRVELSRTHGAERAFTPGEVSVEEEMRRLTAGRGVDATIITASSKTDAIVQQAMEITRRKGRVVVVGDVGLGLKRSPFYEKEIDFLISCSYGPGRYDPAYEDGGFEYPYPYVRWSENRNMSEYLRLVAQGLVQLDGITDREFPVDQAAEAYEELRHEGSNRPLGILLRYTPDVTMADHRTHAIPGIRARVPDGRIGIALVGAGGFARSVHLPNIASLSSTFRLRMIVDASGPIADAAAHEFGAESVSTRFEDALEDPGVDAVVICTRHNLHASMAMQAARKGKAVLVEKPAALTEGELVELEAVLSETRIPFMVGFNRRFAPAIQRAREIVSGRTGPLVALYRVNAGFVSPDHWTQMPEGGGRIIGEACHMIDVFRFLVGDARPVEVMPVSASSVERLPASDNSALSIRYADGSIATLVYTGLGNSSLPKEYVELYADGNILIIDDYRSLRVLGAHVKGWQSPAQDKGHYEELQAFGRLLLDQGENPLPLEQIVEATRLSFVMDGMNKVSR
jgi:predicted dehydrogenase/threonine dehydrogenase-like Zn-dependent dehydrogenase